jgi:hypothetical protein
MPCSSSSSLFCSTAPRLLPLTALPPCTAAPAYGCVQSGEGLAITTYNSATLVTLGGCAPQYRTYQYTVNAGAIFGGSPPDICAVNSSTGAVTAKGDLFVPSGGRPSPGWLPGAALPGWGAAVGCAAAVRQL